MVDHRCKNRFAENSLQKGSGIGDSLRSGGISLMVRGGIGML
ncbi:hypothetical protein CIPAW_06G146700 [Carya illinoinensis]|uniref:Uncharacterized protein n=1 Tax=Carya illinoinensis TaxID=32201 RepID=A0A8T1QC56_CARIL|nr:hypothetical protein CIPAW_06G146700 [Carya illinoinensis]